VGSSFLIFIARYLPCRRGSLSERSRT